LHKFSTPGDFLQSGLDRGFAKICGLFLLFRMVAESAVVIASSLCIFCSFFELKQSVGFILFHGILFLLACIPSMKWDVGIKKWFHLRPFAGDGVEIGSLLVPMVLTSQMAFIERWESKYLKVTGIH